MESLVAIEILNFGHQIPLWCFASYNHGKPSFRINSLPYLIFLIKISKLTLAHVVSGWFGMMKSMWGITPLMKSGFGVSEVPPKTVRHGILLFLLIASYWSAVGQWSTRNVFNDGVLVSRFDSSNFVIIKAFISNLTSILCKFWTEMTSVNEIERGLTRVVPAMDRLVLCSCKWNTGRDLPPLFDRMTSRCCDSHCN